MKSASRLTVIEISSRRSAGTLVILMDRLAFASFVVLLMFGPMAFGAVEAWPQFTLRTAAALLLLLWVARQLLDERITVIWSSIFVPVSLFGLLVIAQSFVFSAYGPVTIAETLNYCSYGMMLFLAVQIVRSDSDALWFARALAMFGFLLACFAIVQNLSAPGMLYWVRRPLHGGAVYGPYVNRNHYAGLMEMIFPIPLVMGLQVDDVVGKKLIWMFCAIVIVGSIALSQSRGGMLAALVEIVALSIYIGRSHRRLALVIVAVVVLTASFVLVSERDNVLSRFGELGSRERLTIAKDGLRMFAKHPFLGWGLGTFPTVYPGFRSFYTDLWVNEAHNDYLQVLIETGAVGFAAVLAFLVLLYRTGSRHLRHWRNSPLAALRLAALTGCTGILVHSFIDFNLHVPANATLFYVLCGISAGAGAIDRRHPADGSFSVRRAPRTLQ